MYMTVLFLHGAGVSRFFVLLYFSTYKYIHTLPLVQRLLGTLGERVRKRSRDRNPSLGHMSQLGSGVLFILVVRSVG